MSVIVLGRTSVSRAPQELEDRRRLEQRAERAAVQRGERRVADQVIGVAHRRDELAVHLGRGEAEVARVGDRVEERLVIAGAPRDLEALDETAARGAGAVTGERSPIGSTA